MIPLVGFLPADDPRVQGTVRAIEQHLMTDGFVVRYADAPDVDGLPPGEGAFLPCTFWLADNLALAGPPRRGRRALRAAARACETTSGSSPRSTTPRRAGCSGTSRRRSRTSRLINTARNLSQPGGPAEHRATG